MNKYQAKKKLQIEIYQDYHKIIKNFETIYKKIKRNKKLSKSLSDYKQVDYSTINMMLHDIAHNKTIFFNFNNSSIKELNKNNKNLTLEKFLDTKYNNITNTITNIDKAVNMSITKKPCTVYRGIHNKSLISQLKKSEKEGIITNYSYTSTSLALSVAIQFSIPSKIKKTKNGPKLIINKKSQRYLMEIEIPKNTNLLYLPWGITNPSNKNLKQEKIKGSELELLLPRGAIFKFISKREQKFIPHRPTWKNLNNKRKISYYIYKLKLVGFKENIIPNADEYKMKELKINPETYKNLLFIGKNNN